MDVYCITVFSGQVFAYSITTNKTLGCRLFAPLLILGGAGGGKVLALDSVLFFRPMKIKGNHP
jgi:hypothetical protein